MNSESLRNSSMKTSLKALFGLVTRLILRRFSLLGNLIVAYGFASTTGPSTRLLSRIDIRYLSFKKPYPG